MEGGADGEQIAEMVAAHGPMMMRLGYVRRARAVDQHANVVDVLILRHILQMCDQLELFAVRLAQAQ